MSAKLKIIRVN